MSTHVRVYLTHAEGGIREGVEAALAQQTYAYEPWLTTRADPFSYGDFWRTVWRRHGDLVVCEQDVMAPPHSIAGLVDCPAPWCTHPIHTGQRPCDDCTGLVKFSGPLRRHLRTLADEICAPQDPRYWVRRGWTEIPWDCTPATLNGPGRRACLKPGPYAAAAADDPRLRPTSHDWIGIGEKLAARLYAWGICPHVHMPQAQHLHHYDPGVSVVARSIWDQPASSWPRHLRPTEAAS